MTRSEKSQVDDDDLGISWLHSLMKIFTLKKQKHNIFLRPFDFLKLFSLIEHSFLVWVWNSWSFGLLIDVHH